MTRHGRLQRAVGDILQTQVEAGAHLLDVNCGAPGVDEPAALERAVYAVSGVASAPLVLDSSDPEALERGLKAAAGKVLNLDPSTMMIQG